MLNLKVFNTPVGEKKENALQSTFQDKVARGLTEYEELGYFAAILEHVMQANENYDESELPRYVKLLEKVSGSSIEECAKEIETEILDCYGGDGFGEIIEYYDKRYPYLVGLIGDVFFNKDEIDLRDYKAE